ncbi:MAG: hypothetical protein COV08_03515 [Candidatus Vogelbacteria bacterium CG10_big_fil_rev_8_21_14_0_10_49_38]|uniref:VTT domain-containing protein n=1 Tax=Candidatus Vogelbacteria bacterium CG10_big_fil_rev_8_21_14_0_10_49_38 TaxID=1975043 RepID=A0A2H0RGX0_9BACT|nr:MAG: hypothetical protein BK006_03505 [bacterium CG10_49_38]PIR45707.1 MAG: hypothetical protein COV08_03515 [Candidatus Vogelbacteria bacterium CG10_big_fil_rev_8_21_14_0_10_49_38]
MIGASIQTVTDWLLLWSGGVPVAWFVLVGSLVEEVLAPIPSAVVMITAGALAAARGAWWLWLLPYAVLGAIGKTAGSWPFYWLADKAEDWAGRKWGRVFGLSHEKIESFGLLMAEKRWGNWLLFALMVLPIFPTNIASVGCGLIKLDPKLYFKITLAGFFIRALLLVSVGYLGLSGLAWLVAG